ncbi:phenylalanine--tRNA ligase subunit beta [Pseudactinotalea sp. Z1748]|uniref:phenylalanine--tRNA ligase subunit beta n=1 Tax=Pseudactinotalea sp. Z1748 TaxID=3413027 RepID=UPI003C7B5706
MPYITAEWLREHVRVPAGTGAADLAADLVRVGLEEEEIHTPGITGPLVVGRVAQMVKEQHSNGRTISWTQVDVGEHNPPGQEARGIVCGAHNFDVGDAVVVALPGAVLPGDFAISARKTYGHVSDGMICSAAELGVGEGPEAEAGIIVLDEGAPAPGTDARGLLGLDEDVLEINVTPDRGYCFSVRGIAREYGHSTGAEFTDPVLAQAAPPEPTPDGFEVVVKDEAPIHGRAGCDRFATRIVRGVDPDAPTPPWMARRLRQAGMRPISVVVDVTNYVMLDVGQPIHAYDLGSLIAPIVVRRARSGEHLVTLDDVRRDLATEDLLITDSAGGHGERILGLAGVMGGAATEVSQDTKDVLIEAAHFDAVSVARTARRHRLPSEAAKRFERGVDPALPPVAAQMVVDLLVRHAGGRAAPAVTDLDRTAPPAPIRLDAAEPARLVGVDYTSTQVVETLTDLGARVDEGEESHLVVTPPTWRPDLVSAADLVEEVVRLRGYDQVPSVLPQARPGRGLTTDQRRRRRVAQVLADIGLVEVLTYPFVAGSRDDELGLAEDDERRLRVRLANPLADNQPYLRSTLLHTLVDAAVRNVGRGLTDLGIFEVGMVTVGTGTREASPLPPLGALPGPQDLAAIEAAVPDQPRHVAGVLTGNAEPPGVYTAARRADHTDAITAVTRIADVLRVPVRIEAETTTAPFHPGRCAVVRAEDGRVLGHAGELAPKVVSALGLPERSVAFEVDLDAMLSVAPREPAQFAPLSTYPAAKEDIALVVPADVHAAQVLATVEEAAGGLAEAVHLFDRYTGESIGAEQVSLAFALRLRAPDRTLTSADAVAVRDAVVDLAAKRHRARLRT